MPVPYLQLGRLAIGFTAITVASGIALIPLYNPGAPLASLEAIHSGIPWAWLLRGIHAFAAHALVVVTIAHGVEVIAHRREQQLRTGVWWRAAATVPLVIMAMLSGFILRGDADAGAAAAVWRGILGQLPAIGDQAQLLLLGTPDNSLSVAALHHVGTFTLLLVVFAAEHSRRLFPDLRAGVLAGLCTVILAGVVPLGLGAAEVHTSGLATGPWYLLGLQGMLLDLPRAVGWLGPVVAMLLLGLLRHATTLRRRLCIASLVVLTLSYLGWTLRLLATHG